MIFIWLGIGFVIGILVTAGLCFWAACAAAPYVVHEVYRE